MIKIAHRSRLRINENLSGCVNASPFLEKASRKLRCYSETRNRVSPSPREGVLNPLPGARLSRHQDEVSELAQSDACRIWLQRRGFDAFFSRGTGELGVCFILV